MLGSGFLPTFQRNKQESKLHFFKITSVRDCSQQNGVPTPQSYLLLSTLSALPRSLVSILHSTIWTQQMVTAIPPTRSGQIERLTPIRQFNQMLQVCQRFAHLYLRTTRQLNVLNKNTLSLHPPSLTAGHKITKLFIAQCKSVRKVDLARIKTQIIGDYSFFEKSEDIFTYLGWCLPFESSPTPQFQHYKVSVQISCRKSSKKVLGQ